MARQGERQIVPRNAATIIPNPNELAATGFKH